jgi:uncharacterized protein YjbI with pentapeptide repeats
MLTYQGLLSMADLTGADLRYADLSGTNLEAITLRKADLRYADCSEVGNAVSIRLDNADIRYANIEETHLGDASSVAGMKITSEMLEHISMDRELLEDKRVKIDPE